MGDPAVDQAGVGVEVEGAYREPVGADFRGAGGGHTENSWKAIDFSTA